MLNLLRLCGEDREESKESFISRSQGEEKFVDIQVKVEICKV